MFPVETPVRLLKMDGTISTDVYLVEEDKNSGEIRLILENTVVRDDADKITSGKRIIVNAQRVFDRDAIDGKAPVINISPDEAEAHCPVCGDSHQVTAEDTAITCHKHGAFELFRTKEQVHKKKSSKPSKPRKETKTVDSTTAPAPAPPATAGVEIDAIKALGELWSKRLDFDYSHIDAKGYILLVEIDGTTMKHCFNTYNGNLGKKPEDNDLSRFTKPKGAYKVPDVAKERIKLTAKGYTKV